MPDTPTTPRQADLAIRQEIESDPDVQTALVEVMDELPDPKVQEGRQSGPHTLLDQRNEYIVNLYVMGLTARTIQKMVNQEATRKGWATIQHEKSINRIISQHYAAMQPNARDAREYDLGIRQATYARLNHMVERLALFIRNKDKNSWKPFEYQATMETLIRAQQLLIENQNWNASRMNPQLAIQINSSQINVFQQGTERLIAGEKSEGWSKLMDYLDASLE